MTYSALLVHLELGRSNAGVLGVAADLAGRCHADVIGIAVCRSIVASLSATGYVSGEALQCADDEIAKEQQEAEAEFRTLLGGLAGNLEWRCASLLEAPSAYLSREARTADLVITAPDRGGAAFLDPRHIDIADLVLTAGRPVLLMPGTENRLHLQHALLAWKDGRAARRSAWDALPLLKLATHVTVAAVDRESEAAAVREGLTDVVQWLASHDIAAEPTSRISGGSEATALAGIVRTVHADLVIAGAYGHRRWSEWALGGVTRDVHPPFSSHPSFALARCSSGPRRTVQASQIVGILNDAGRPRRDPFTDRAGAAQDQYVTTV